MEAGRVESGGGWNAREVAEQRGEKNRADSRIHHLEISNAEIAGLDCPGTNSWASSDSEEPRPCCSEVPRWETTLVAIVVIGIRLGWGCRRMGSFLAGPCPVETPVVWGG